MDGWWASLQFDRAVSYFGRYVESRLNEYDEGKPVHTLDELLGDPDTPDNDLQAFLRSFGGALGVVNR